MVFQGLLMERCASNVELAIETGCIASYGGSQQAKVPPIEDKNVLELILKPNISIYSESGQKRIKTPYNIYLEGAVSNLSDEDDDEI